MGTNTIIPPKINKIAHISVRDFRKIVFTQKPKAFTFFNISHEIFRIGVRPADFRIWPTNFLRPKSKIKVASK